jgi:hypothetical protein
MSPHVAPLNFKENDDFGEGAPRVAAHESMEEGFDAGLSALIEAWNTLDCDAREAVLAIINAMKRGKVAV